MTCTEIEELVGAYVLDAVTPEEREAVEAHIAQCPRCTKLVQEMRETVNFLPLSVPQIKPSPQLKERILAAVQDAANTSLQSPQDVPVVPVARPLRPLPSPVEERPAPQLPTPIRRRAAAQRWAMPLVAAAAVLFLLLSGALATWGISLQHQVTGLQANTESLQQQVQSLSANAITTTIYAIKGTSQAPGITGEAEHIVGNGVNVTVLTLRGLPKLEGQEVYQGWEIKGKATKSIGLLTTQADGSATISIPGDVKGNDAVAVSLEKGPKATPNAPQGEVLALGPVKK